VVRARLLTWLFAVLLLGMQQATQVHALSHLGGLLDRPHEQGLQAAPSDTPCVVCSLCAGGLSAIVSHTPPDLSIAALSSVAWVIASSPTTSAPTYYLSRAPPTLL
jgi:hypothetical protein